MPDVQAVAHYSVTAGHEAEVLALLREYAEIVRTEPGNRSFEVLIGLDDPCRVVLLERYSSRQAVIDHRNTLHFRRFVLDRIIPLLDSRVVEQFDVAPSE